VAPVLFFFNGYGKEEPMDVFLLSVVSAFILFAVLLPLAGVVIGLFCYYVLPYVFGGLVTLIVLVLAGVKFLFTWWVWGLALIWASAVFAVKMMFRKLGEEIEHHRAAEATLLCGVPYRRKRDQLREAEA
jgi:hypothetical protein